MSTFADAAGLERLPLLEEELGVVKAYARDTASELKLAMSDAASLQEELGTARKAAEALRMSNHQAAGALQAEAAGKLVSGDEELERLRKVLEVGSWVCIRAWRLRSRLGNLPLGISVSNRVT